MKKIFQTLSVMLGAVLLPSCLSGQITALADSQIPADAKEWQGNYYYVYDDASSWEDAVAKCEKRGGHLATITSADEDEIVYGCLEEKGYKDGYFGLFREEAKEKKDWKWQWVTGEAFSYENWKAGEPNGDYGGTEAYGGYWDGSKWNDFRPTQLNVYICEWDSENYTEQNKEEENTTEEIEEPNNSGDDTEQNDKYIDTLKIVAKKNSRTIKITTLKNAAVTLSCDKAIFQNGKKSISTKTNSQGIIEVKLPGKLASGTIIKVTVEAEGYETRTDTVKVKSAKTIQSSATRKKF